MAVGPGDSAGSCFFAPPRVPDTLCVMSIRRVGVLADTHGSVLPDVLNAFTAASVDVIEQLGRLAPVVAVAGNGDEPLYHRFPWDLRLMLEERRILLCHWYDNYGRIHPGYRALVAVWRPHVLVYGHTHQSVVDQQGETLYLNPGYAGAPEPSRRRSVAVLDLQTLQARLCPL
jgi:putative phosphoesterase